MNDVVLTQVLVRFGDDDDETDRVVAGVQQPGGCWMGATRPGFQLAYHRIRR